MRKLKIVLFKGYFGQSLPTPKSINTEDIKNHLEQENFDVSFCEVEDLQNEDIDPNTYYLFGSHQNPDVKKYYDDVVSILFPDSRNCIPIAKYILAHENKGVQTLLNESLELGMPNQSYKVVNSPQKMNDYGRVHKLVSGSGSSGVFLPLRVKELFRKFWTNLLLSLTISELVSYTKLKIKNVLGFVDKDTFEYYSKYLRIVTQDTLKSVGYDYKVLVFGKTCFVLKRNVRPNDFRSSGSGRFEFIEADESLLQFALDFKEKLSVPYVSLDIMNIVGSPGKYACIEFQCTHFGPYTKNHAPFGYEFIDKWSKIPNSKSLEEIMAKSIVMYINDIENPKVVI